MSIDDFVPKIDEAQTKILEQLSNHGNDESYSSFNQQQSAHDDCHSDNELLPDVSDQAARLFVDDTQTVLTTSAEYKRKHFSNTSSSSESDSDDSITRGLEFKNIPVVATIESQSSSHLHLDDVSFYPSAPSSAVPINKKSSQMLSKALESEEEISDFEFLEKDDLNK